MDWVHLLKYFFAGIFLANAIPHFVHGISGKKFQSPFAKPPGIGLSSAMVNVLWAWVNIFAGLYLGFHKVNPFASMETTAALLAGAFVVSVSLAWHFGRVYAK
ncbi:MAG TPA: hypothetical protein VIM85_06405 [Pseudomonadales bacterium]